MAIILKIIHNLSRPSSVGSNGKESTAAAETSSDTVNGIHEIIMVLLLAFRVSTL